MNGFIAQRQRNTPRKHWSPKERYQTVVKLQQQLARASSSGECRLNDANNVLYRVKYKDALLQGSGLVAMYGNSFALAVMTEVPDHAWKPWRFRSTPRGWWKSVADLFKRGDIIGESCIRTYLEDFGFKTAPGCLDAAKLLRNSNVKYCLFYIGGVTELLNRLNNTNTSNNISFSNSDVANQFEWKENPIEALPDLTTEYGRRKLLEHIVTASGQKTDNIELALYSVRKDHIKRAAGEAPLKPFGNSAVMAVLVSYPEIFWKVWKFTKSPNGWWRQLAELVEAGDVLATALTRIFIEDMCEEAGIREKPFDNYGKLSLTHHQMESMLQQLAPRYDYSFAHFKGGLLRTHKVLTDGGDFTGKSRVGNDYFARLLEHMGGKLENMYHISLNDIVYTGGLSLLPRKNRSLAQFVIDNYPGHPWKMWKFNRTPRGWWIKLGHRLRLGDSEAIKLAREYLSECAQELSITDLQDWYNVGIKSLDRTTYSQIRIMAGGLPQLLQLAFPDHNWDPTKFKLARSQVQTKQTVMKAIINDPANLIAKK